MRSLDSSSNVGVTFSCESSRAEYFDVDKIGICWHESGFCEMRSLAKANWGCMYACDFTRNKRVKIE